MIPALTLVLFVLGLFQTGLTSVIQSVETVEEAVGEDALLSCQILLSENVVHVKWLKPTLDGLRYLTSNNIHGSTVISDFRGKVEVKDGGLNNSSIVIKNVTEEDEGCYLCLFITKPAGALTGRTCLKVYELHEPVLHVRESNSTDEFLVSCSATGRPAPTVTLNLTQQDFHLSQNQTVVINTNGTFTVTATAVLAGFHDAGRRVGCAAQVLSHRKEAFVVIPDVKVTPTSGLDEGSGSASRSFIVMWIVGVTCLCTASALAVLLIRKLRSRSFRLSHRDQEKTEVPQTADADTVKEPLFTPEKTPPSSESKHLKETDTESSSTARRTQSDQLSHRDQEKTEVPQTADADAVKESLFTPEKTPPPSESKQLKETDTESSSTARTTQSDQAFRLSHRDHDMTEVPQTADADTVKEPLFTPEKSRPKRGVPPSKMGKKKATGPESSSTARRTQSDQSFSLSHRDQEKTEVPQTADADMVKEPLFTPEKTPPPSESKQLKETNPESSSTARRTQSDQSFRLSLRNQEKTEVPQTADAATVKIPLFTPEEIRPKRGAPPSKMGKKKATDPELSSTARRTQSDQVKIPLLTPVKSSVREQSPPSESKQKKATDPESSSPAKRLDLDK